MSLKHILLLALVAIVLPGYVGSNLLPIFNRGHYAEYITEIILRVWITG